MKNKKVYNMILFSIGLIFLSLGINFVLKSELGVSVATSFPSVLSKKFQNISFGTWNYIAHGFITIILIFITKKIKLYYIFSFIVSFIFGKLLDFFGIVLFEMFAQTVIIKVFFFTSGTILISLGVALLMKSDYPILPFDTFVKEISELKNIKVGKVKTYFDLTHLSLSVIFSLIFFGKIKLIGIGTVVSAFIFGTLIGNSLDFFNKTFDGIFILDEKLVMQFLNKDLLG